MANYQKLYTLLFNAVTDAVADLQQLNIGTAKERLIAAQQQTEELYIAEEASPEQK